MKYQSGEKTKEKMMLAAFELFAEKGYLNTSIGDIMKKVGLTKGNFYNHYASKKELLFDVIHYFHKSTAVVNDMDEPFEFYRWLKRQAEFEKNVENPEIWRRAHMEIRCNMKHDPDVQAIMKKVYEEWLPTLTAAVQKGQELHQIRNDKQAKELAEFVQVVYDGFMVHRHIHEDKSLDEFIAYIKLAFYIHF
jgi:AcrR family transcriptional regulator